MENENICITKEMALLGTALGVVENEKTGRLSTIGKVAHIFREIKR
jgi:hypothetical protein